MSIDDVYKLIQFCVNKNQSGYLTPEEFQDTINMAQRNYISYLLGSFQRYAPGRAVANVELGQNMTVRQRLTPVIYGIDMFVSPSTGTVTYPGDFLQVDAMWSIYGYSRVRAVQQDSWYQYYNSVIDPVATNPIYMVKDTGMQFAPESIGFVKMSYVRNPPNMVWGNTANIYGIPIYDPATSVQPVWDDLAIFEIITRALAMVGVNLQSAQVAGYAETIKREGQ